MRIIGPEDLVFGVDDMEACCAYGLTEIVLDNGGYRFEALEGTAMSIHRRDDPALPPALETGNMLRQTVWGCEDQETVGESADELVRDRPVVRQADGSITTTDDVGFQMAFRVTTRRPIELVAERVNSPGAKPVAR